MPAAARVTDNHVCPMSDGPKPHVGGPIMPPCSINVLTNSIPQARVTDRAVCVSPAPDFIVTGSSTVLVNGLMAARLTDKTMHGGTISPICSPDVIMGGATAGATLGFPDAWLQTFNAQAAGRASGAVQQSFQNCGVESSRALILANGGNVSEQNLLNWAVANGNADNSDPSPTQWGGTSPNQRAAILTQYGVANHQEPQTRENITQAIAEGRGVITSHDAGKLWNNPSVSGGHAITVTGAEYNPDGSIKNIITNDTGLGQGRNSVPANQFFDSLRTGRNANVTDNPLKR